MNEYLKIPIAAVQNLLLICYKGLGNFQYSLSKRRYSNTLEKIQKDIANKRIKSIYVNRTDRIGDAIVCLPLFMQLSKQSDNIIFLTSRENDWVLKPFVKTKIEHIDIESHGSKVYNSLLKTLLKKSNRTISSAEIYVDLKTDYELSAKYQSAYKVGYKNFLLNVKYSDFVFNRFISDKYQFSETFRDLFELLLKNDIMPEEFPDELKRYCTKKRDVIAETYIKSKYIIFYVGSKEFRNLSPECWARIISGTKYTGRILIVDEPLKHVSGKVSKILKDKRSVFVKEKFDLWTLMYIGMKSDLVIGVDGGGMHFIGAGANVLEIMPFANPYVWRPYSNNKYKKVYAKDKEIIEKTKTSQGLSKTVYYIDEPLRTTYEYFGIRKPIFENIKTETIINEINKIITKEKVNNYGLKPTALLLRTA